MKKRFILPVLAVILALSLTMAMAVPALADTNLSLTIEATPSVVNSGDPVNITVTVTNTGTGDSYFYQLDIDVYINGVYDHTLTPPLPFYPLDSESWTWSMQVYEPTTISVVAEGYSYTCTELKRYEAQASVDVTSDGGEGLTPGYWKNHYPESWPAGVLDTTPLSDHVTVGDYSNPAIPMMDALTLKGGKEKALVRHAAAAVLNALHPNIDYPLTIAGIQAILDDVGLTVEQKKDILEEYNEMEGDINS